jgi:hypothetical protein
MRNYLDCEFIDDGRTIELISIAIVAEDGRELYEVSSEFDPKQAGDFVRENVLPKLPPKDTWKTRRQIRDAVKAFLLDDGDGSKPEIWAYFGAYDWVALAQLFGPMVDLPKGMPHFAMDVKQEMERLGLEKSQVPRLDDSEAHDALADARWTKRVHDFIREGTGDR